jgi:hypothetical protein
LVVDKAKLPMLRAALGDPEAPAAR